MKHYFFSALVVLVLAACEETVTLDLRERDTKLVLDAQVLNRPRGTYVKISTTAAFSSVGNTPRVTNAAVRLLDERGQVVPFVHNPRNHPDSAGFYLPSRRFTARANAIYTMEVTQNGITYTATDALPAVTNIGRLIAAVDTEAERNPRIAGRIYNVLISFVLPEDDAYYQVKFLRNDVPTRNAPQDVYLIDRQETGTDVEDLSFPVLFSSKEKATVQLYRISKNVYTYYSDVINATGTDGGLLSPPPSNPRTNWSNGAIGIFRACALHERSIVIP